MDINTKDLYQTFNMGIGLVLIVDESKKEKLISFIGRDNCNSIGVVVNDKDNMVHLYE